MSGGKLQVLDGAGREIVGAIDDQPLRIQLELDIDPGSAPDEITVDIIGPDGIKETITAERIDWGAKRPLYQSDLTTIDELFSQFLEGLNPLLGHAPPRVGNGDVVRFEHEDLTHDVQVFDSTIDARYWFTEAELADRIGAATTRGIALTNVLRQLRRYPESDQRAVLEQDLTTRIRHVRSYLGVLDTAKNALQNPKYYAEQRIRAAHYYMALEDPRDATGVHDALEAAKETAQGHIVSGMGVLTIGGYRMLVQATGVAQLRTMLTGEDEVGHAVGWDGRAVAFLDLVADGLLQGANMKYQLDNLVAPTRTPTVKTRVRYRGPNPETLAPELSIVDPAQMGMPPAAVRAAFRAARRYNRIPLVRPTNPEALGHLADGNLPKPESLKSKTVNELDTLLGMQPENRALVALFEPKTTFFESAYRTSGMSDTDIATKLDSLRSGTAVEPPPGFAGTELWDRTVTRFMQRSEEFHGPTGVSTRKLADAGVVKIENGLVVDVETGKFYTGDHDLFDFVDSLGNSVTPEVYRQMVSFLESSEFHAQHGAHKWWDPQRSDFPAGEFGDAKFATARGIYDKIIEGHKKGGEILIAFPPVGPPIALFSGTAPSPYLGHTPGPFKPVAPGSSLKLPTDIRLLGVAGTASHGLQHDDSVQEWIDAGIDFDASATTLDLLGEGGGTDAFDAFEAAAAARVAQFDADLGSGDEGGFDPSEFDVGEPGAEGEEATGGDAGGVEGTSGGTDAFDAFEAAAAARVAQFDADLGSGDEGGFDPSEFDVGEPGAEGEEATGGVGSSKPGVGMMTAAGVIAVIFLIGGLAWLFGGGGETSGDPQAVTTSAAGSGADGGDGSGSGESGETGGAGSGGAAGVSDEPEETDSTTTSQAPGPVTATVNGVLEWDFVPDPKVNSSVSSSVLTMEFSSEGGPFTGSAVLELLHDVPSEGCQFQSRHAWDFSGDFNPETLEFLGTFVEVDDVTTGNCTPDQLSFEYRTEPPQGLFYAGLYLSDGEIRGSSFARFSAPVDQVMLDSLMPDDDDDSPDNKKPQVDLFHFATPLEMGSPGQARMNVYVTNVGEEVWSAGTFTDAVYGNLFDAGPSGSNTCAGQEWTVEPGDVMICGFWVDVDGPAPREQKSEMTIEVFDADGDSATATQESIIKLVLGPQKLKVEKFADPVTVGASGGPVTFTVRVTNLSDEVVVLGYLIDDVFGNLMGADVPYRRNNFCPIIDTRLDPDETVECTFIGDVFPLEDGGAHENTVAALVYTGIEPFASASDTAIVQFEE